MSTLPLADLQDDRVLLRPLAAADLPLTLAWRNRDDIRCCFVHSDVITPDQHQAWFESYCRRDDDFVFIIEERQRLCRPVGQVSLYHIDWANKRAEYGRLMIGDPAARGQGLASDATRLLLDAAFKQFGLCEIYLEVFAHNTPAIAVYRSCGFEASGQHGNLLLMTQLSVKEAGPKTY
jgi:RimJ/RimL family protein N-acetyltransferase